MPQFNHIALYVADLQKATRFYEEVLELKRIEEPFKQGKHSWFHMGEHCQLHLVHQNVQRNESRNWHYAFTVPDLEAFVQKLEKAGIPYGDLGEPSKKITLRPDGIKQVYFQDPDGYWLEANEDRY